MLDELKMLLDIDEGDISQDKKLQSMLKSSENRLKVLLGGLDPPEEMNYIIVEVTVIRYNRIGSEGFTSHSVGGESITVSEDDFAAYRDDIQTYLNNQKEAKKGKVRFL